MDYPHIKRTPPDPKPANARRPILLNPIQMTLTPTTELPPFPDRIPTVPLVVIDYQLIKAGHASEIERLFRAGKELGFW